jgi:hypothetical protein
VSKHAGDDSFESGVIPAQVDVHDPMLTWSFVLHLETVRGLASHRLLARGAIGNGLGASVELGTPSRLGARLGFLVVQAFQEHVG